MFVTTDKEHDANLINPMKRAKREGLVFNSTKCYIKKSDISFFGNTKLLYQRWNQTCCQKGT